MEYEYGYNDGARGGPYGVYVGPVHIFRQGERDTTGRPLCGKRQHYIPAGKGETPLCATCKKSAA